MLAALIATCGDGAAAAIRRGAARSSGRARCAVRGAARRKGAASGGGVPGAAGRSGRARLSRPRRRTAERQPAGSSGQRDRLVVRGACQHLGQRGFRTLGSASDGAANGAPEASRDDGSAGAPRPAALQRRPPPTVRSTRALPATAPAPARAARSSRSPPARSYTSQPTSGTAPRRQPGPRGRRDRAGDRLRRRRRACRDLHGFRLGERRASLRRALSGRRRLLLGRRSRVARASAPEPHAAIARNLPDKPASPIVLRAASEKGNAHESLHARPCERAPIPRPAPPACPPARRRREPSRWRRCWRRAPGTAARPSQPPGGVVRGIPRPRRSPGRIGAGSL